MFLQYRKSVLLLFKFITKVQYCFSCSDFILLPLLQKNNVMLRLFFELIKSKKKILSIPQKNHTHFQVEQDKSFSCCITLEACRSAGLLCPVVWIKIYKLVSNSKAGNIFFSRHFGKPYVMQRYLL